MMHSYLVTKKTISCDDVEYEIFFQPSGVQDFDSYAIPLSCFYYISILLGTPKTEKTAEKTQQKHIRKQNKEQPFSPPPFPFPARCLP